MSCFSCVKFRSKDVKNYDDDIKFNGVADGKIIDSIGEKRVRSQKANVAHTFTFHDLAIATQNFKDDNLIGEGGFGSVYKGQLESGEIVAVKKLNLNGSQGNQEFIVEVLMLSLLRHSNLVTLTGYCADGDQRLLVYEHMPQGSLENHLFDLEPDREPLDWHTRLKVAVGAARGLEYLHCKANPPVIYRDLKSSNILLDNDFKPKLSDFGLAKLGPVGDNTHVSTRVMGTYGYCALEYAMSGKLTIKSDIYSFGVVLLELITGRKVIDMTKKPREQNLVSWCKKQKMLVYSMEQFPDMTGTPRDDKNNDGANGNANNSFQELANLISGLVTQLNQANQTLNQNRGVANPPVCTFKHFNSRNPLKFMGSEGATGMLQWFESIENTIINSDCPENLKVRYATSVFQKRALTWWNGEKRTRGVDAALALTWAEVKKLMTTEFCPHSEMRKLEAELWELKQDSGENVIFKTIYGSNPTTLEAAIRLSATLIDNHVKAGILTRKGSKKVDAKSAAKEASTEVKTEQGSSSKSSNKKRKTRNFVVTTPAAKTTQQSSNNSNTRNYVGATPQSQRMQPAPLALPVPHAQPIQAIPIRQSPAQARACYEFGDVGHFRNQCPKLTGNNQRMARGRAFQLKAPAAQAN
ncbi:hypothetical protein E3N88_40212 [Mikania micrantha]|uniref:non-specific serine/threonine protein kinase n=1 Tax=Mikania micrantha TaxID=192012 RepID=A0A5N6LM39_9ASTR|nr:hypothetical protein E3N88_40212 [Mikania micrantha]